MIPRWKWWHSESEHNMAENDDRDYSSNIELVLQPIQYNSLMLKVFFNRIKAEILLCLSKGEELVQNAP